MASPKRPYEAPVVRTEEFKLGVYGDYGQDTGSFMPVEPGDTDGRPNLHMD